MRLADLYLDTGETEKAKQIITEAKETLPEEEREEIEKLEEERKDELDGEEPIRSGILGYLPGRIPGEQN